MEKGDGFSKNTTIDLGDGTELVPAQSSPLQGVRDLFGKGSSSPPPSPSAIDLGDGTELVGEPTLQEKATEVMYGTGIGAAQGGGTFGTAVAGARTAAAAMPIPQLKPAAGVVGGLVGLTAGYLATHNIDQLFPELARADLIPYREGGKTFGETIASAPVAFGIPVMQANRVARMISTIGEGARKYPKSYLAGELLSGIGAGTAGGISESYFPGEAGPRFGAEVAGGMFTPGRMLVSGAGAINNAITGIASSFSASSREGRAANALYKILSDSQAGTDVPKLIKLLEQPLPSVDGEIIKPTAGQKTGDLGLTILETTLARRHAEYGGKIADQGAKAMMAYEELVSRLRNLGSPEALQLAAKLRADKTEAMLEDRLTQADEVAASKIAKIQKDSPQTRPQIGEIVRSETERALADARSHEKELWDRAYKGSLRTKTVKGQKVLVFKEVNPANAGESFLEIATSMTPERFNYRMPAEIKGIMARLGVDESAIAQYAAGKRTQEYLQTGKVPMEYLTKVQGKKIVPLFKNTNIQDLINIRSDLLAFSREAAASGKTAEAGFYGKMAESVLDDLASSKNPAYDDARQFSRQLNDFFTRTYSGDISAVNKKGADKLPAEVLISKAFGSNNDVTALRMGEIEDAVGMMGKQYDDAVTKFGANSPQAQQLKPYADVSKQQVVSIRDANARVLRLAALETLDPVTQRVSPARLQQFVNKNKDLLGKLGLTDDLSDAVKAETAYLSLKSDFSAVNLRLKEQAAFSKVLQAGENPTLAITDAINSRYPVKTINSIVRLAKASGPDAVAGLKSTMYDYAFTKASTGNGNFSAEAFNKAFFEPIANGQPSIYNILRSQDAISLTEAKNMKRLINPMIRIEAAIKSNRVTDDVVNGADALLELGLRATGAKFGAELTPGSTGSLVAASAGSKFMRKQFDKLPTMMVKNILEEASKDPQAMALLLRRGVSQNQKYDISAKLAPFLARTAFGARAPMLNLFDPGPPPEEEAPTMDAGFPRQARKLMQSFPTAQTRGTKPQAKPPTPAPAAPSAPQGPAGAPVSNSRKMLQSLFPMDTISGMGAA